MNTHRDHEHQRNNKHLYMLGIILGLFAFFSSALMMIAWIPLLKISYTKGMTYIIIYSLGMIASVWLVNFLARRIFDEQARL